MKTFRQWLESDQNLPSVAIVKTLMPKIVNAAQHAYDQWDQNEDGYDEELGGGGICQDIADGIADVLNNAGIEARIVDNNGVGEQHVWVVAKFKEGIYEVDIPPHEYETGGGYSWRKIPNVTFTPRHVIVHPSYMSEEDFESDSW